MYVDSKFISDVVNGFAEVCPGDSQLCVAKDMFGAPNYASEVFQYVYAMRYVPAYYFEYCVLASELSSRVKGYAHLNVASIGAGLCQDYYALRDNVKIPFTYSAYDAVQWAARARMPPVGDNFNIVAKSAQKISAGDLADVDVYFFPKSLSDIAGSGNGVLSAFGGNIAATKKKRLFFLVSYVSAGINKSPASQDFSDIDKALTAAGFSTTDQVRGSFYRGDKNGEGLRALHQNFIYPSNVKISCSSQDGLKCIKCDAIKSPIYKNTHMSFSIMEYTK